MKTTLPLKNNNLISSIAQSEMLNQAFNWLFKSTQNAQGANKKRLVDYVNRWISWAKAGVSLINAPLKLNIKIHPSKQRGYSFKLFKNEWPCCL